MEISIKNNSQKVEDLSYTTTIDSNLYRKYTYFEQNRTYIQKSEESYYNYSKLDEEQKKLYDLLLNGILDFSENGICIDGINEEYFWENYKKNKFAYSLIKDRPILFDFIGSIPRFEDNKCIYKFSKIFFGKEVTVKDLKKIYYEMENKVDNILKNMPKNLTIYGKYNYLANQICDINEYDFDKHIWGEQQRAYGVFYLGKSVCEGYAWAYQYLCNKAGLYCVKNNFYCYYGDKKVGHSFNTIKLYDGTYYVDTTWMYGGSRSENFVFTKENAYLTGHEGFLEGIDDEVAISTGKAYMK